MSIARVYERPKGSILLLGPRGTGKSTWVREVLKPDFTIDLLNSREFRELQLRPETLEDWVGHLKKNQTVFIDEIQKIPELLSEVHRLIEDRKLVFFLTGSSTRKLRSKGVNLLAGRALSKKMFPLTMCEVFPQYSIEDLLYRGGLPQALQQTHQNDLFDFLSSYVQTYLKEEIFQEGLTRSLARFSQFIELAAQYHGQTLNYEAVAREMGMSGDAVKAWFQILEDTLLATVLPSYPLKLFSQENKHSRFYLFDAGVARAAEGFVDFSETPERKGFYLEGLVLNELRAYAEVHRKNWKLGHLAVPRVGAELSPHFKRQNL